MAHPHRRDAARRRRGRRSPRDQHQHDPRRAEIPMRMTDDRSVRWTDGREREEEGREGRKTEARNRRSPVAVGRSVGRSVDDEKEREKSRDKQRALPLSAPRLASPWRPGAARPGQERAGGGFHQILSLLPNELQKYCKVAISSHEPELARLPLTFASSCPSTSSVLYSQFNGPPCNVKIYCC